jgi:hypothetical protein
MRPPQAGTPSQRETQRPHMQGWWRTGSSCRRRFRCFLPVLTEEVAETMSAFGRLWIACRCSDGLVIRMSEQPQRSKWMNSYHDLCEHKKHERRCEVTAGHMQCLTSQISTFSSLCSRPPTRVTPRRTSRMLLKMMIPTSIKLNCRAKDASSSVLTSADDSRERRDASRSVMRSVVEDDCLVDTKSTLYSDYT